MTLYLQLVVNQFIFSPQAVYENTRQMLDGSAAIYDEVVCRCSIDPDDRLDRPRRGQGCDSIDNDCDQIVDEW